MRRPRRKTRLALAVASLAFAASGMASTGAHASCILDPLDGSCLNVCPPTVTQKLHVYCTY